MVMCISLHFEEWNYCVANIVPGAGLDPLATEETIPVCVCVCVCVCVFMLFSHNVTSPHNCVNPKLVPK